MLAVCDLNRYKRSLLSLRRTSLYIPIKYSITRHYFNPFFRPEPSSKTLQLVHFHMLCWRIPQTHRTEVEIKHVLSNPVQMLLDLISRKQGDDISPLNKVGAVFTQDAVQWSAVIMWSTCWVRQNWH
jgi:hypothetical protein